MVPAVLVSRRFLLTVIAAALALTLAAPLRADEPIDAEPLPTPPLEFQPYRVTCEIAADPVDPRLEVRRDQLVRELPSWIARMVGQRWDFTAVAARDPQWAVTGELARLADMEIPLAEEASLQIHYRAVVRRASDRLVVDVREYEPAFLHASPLRQVVCIDERTLSSAIATELLNLFRPRGVWERVDDRTVRLRIQAAALADGNARQPLVRPGDAFAPWLLFRNRERLVQKVQEYPWTVLVIDELEDGRGTANVVSGLRNPLGARPRGRIELLAVALRPQWSESSVQVLARSQPPRPLPAHRIELTDVAPEVDVETSRSPGERLTDRDGVVRLPRLDAPRLQWMRITSGDLLLAKVPVLSGSFSTAQLELPDDHLRLLAEGELKVLQGDVVSVVAQRSALMAAARAKAKQKQWDSAKNLLAEIHKLSSPQSFKERVSAIRVAGVTAAREQRDKVAEQRINRLCDDTEELVRHYLASDKVKQLQEELAELEAALKQE